MRFPRLFPFFFPPAFFFFFSFLAFFFPPAFFFFTVFCFCFDFLSTAFFSFVPFFKKEAILFFLATAATFNMSLLCTLAFLFAASFTIFDFFSFAGSATFRIPFFAFGFAASFIILAFIFFSFAGSAFFAFDDAPRRVALPFLSWSNREGLTRRFDVPACFAAFGGVSSFSFPQLWTQTTAMASDELTSKEHSLGPLRFPAQ